MVNPAQPQREDERLLLSVPAGQAAALRELHLVYEMPVETVALWSEIDLPAPRLLFPADGPAGPAVEVPVAELVWQLCPPTGYGVVRYGGTVSTDELTPPEPAAWSLARGLYELGGGVHLFHGFGSAALSRASELAQPAPSGELRELGVELKEAEVSATAPPTDEDEPAAVRGTLHEKAARPVVAGYQLLEGVRSLDIQLETVGETVAFQSLGVQPRLRITLSHVQRIGSLAWSLALAVGLIGLALTFRRAGTKAVYVATVAALTTLLPLVSSRPELAGVVNLSFYAAAGLVPYYVLVWLAMWVVRGVRRALLSPLATAVAVVLTLGAGGDARAEPPAVMGSAADPVVVRIVEQPEPVAVPDDAIVVPYDPASACDPDALTAQLGRILIPYDTFAKLWRRAHPAESAMGKPATYALAGAAYAAALTGPESLELTGHIDISVYVDEPIAIPLRLDGAVLTRAELDGEPASLSAASCEPPRSAKSGSRPVAPALILPVQGQGHHRLDLTLRMRLQRNGGWREVRGRLPAAPATALTLQVPTIVTEVWLGAGFGRRTYETKTPNEVIETALPEDGTLHLRWRPRVHEGQVDPSLTVNSQALLDIREDGLRTIWRLKLDFGRSERKAFTLVVPAEYLVESVGGANVRGWTPRPDDALSADSSDGQRVEVTLLKPATGSEELTVALHQPTGAAGLARFTATTRASRGGSAAQWAVDHPAQSAPGCAHRAHRGRHPRRCRGRCGSPGGPRRRRSRKPARDPPVPGVPVRRDALHGRTRGARGRRPSDGKGRDVAPHRRAATECGNPLPHSHAHRPARLPGADRRARRHGCATRRRTRGVRMVADARA